jgi:arylsulfatase
MILETGAIVNQLKMNTDNTDVVEMNNISLKEMNCELIPFYAVGDKNILPFWVEIERIN